MANKIICFTTVLFHFLSWGVIVLSYSFDKYLKCDLHLRLQIPEMLAFSRIRMCVLHL